MISTEYSEEKMQFVVEGENTRVLGIGEVVGKIVVAESTSHLAYQSRFNEEGVIPVVLDEMGASMGRNINLVTE
jgi:hypothetical protein